MRANTQSDDLLRYLRKYGAITDVEAFTHLGIRRLSARIYDLRHKEGLEIRAIRCVGKNRHEHTTNYCRYELVPEQEGAYEEKH